MQPTNIKQEAHRLVEKLPENATWDDLMYEIYVRQAVEAGRLSPAGVAFAWACALLLAAQPEIGGDVAELGHVAQVSVELDGAGEQHVEDVGSCEEAAHDREVAKPDADVCIGDLAHSHAHPPAVEPGVQRNGSVGGRQLKRRAQLVGRAVRVGAGEVMPVAR